MAGQEDKDRIISRIRDGIAGMPSLRLAYLYGSYPSRDDFRDIDIAVLVSEQITDQERMVLASHAKEILENEFGFLYEFDVRILNDEPAWFQYEVIRSGIPLFIRNDDDRIDFETRVLVEYQDIKFMYDLFDNEYLAKA